MSLGTAHPKDKEQRQRARHRSKTSRRALGERGSNERTEHEPTVHWQPACRAFGGHLAEVAGRFPETMLICAHICGGGDWEWTVKALRNAPSVYLDTSGSVIDEGTVEFAVRTLGAGRVLFACVCLDRRHGHRAARNSTTKTAARS
jgi:hypothetical protein